MRQRLFEGGDQSPISRIHAKGRPSEVNGHVRMGLSNQLSIIDGGSAVGAKYAEFRNTPVIIGESDPEGCAACTWPSLAYGQPGCASRSGCI